MTMRINAKRTRAARALRLSGLLLSACSLLNTVDDPPSDRGSKDAEVEGDLETPESASDASEPGEIRGHDAMDGGLEAMNGAAQVASSDRELGPAAMEGGTSAVTDDALPSSQPDPVLGPTDAQVTQEASADAAMPDAAGSCAGDAAACGAGQTCQHDAASCFAPAACLARDGGYRCACPGYYEDVYGDGALCRDARFLSIAAFGAGGANLGYSMAIDTSGNAFLVGTFQDRVTFGALPGHATAGEFDAYVVKLDPDRTPIWSRRFGSTGDDRAFRVAEDTKGDVLVIGNISGEVSFDTLSLGHPGTWASYVVKLSGLDGHVLWARALPAASYYDVPEFAHVTPLEGWAWDVAVDARDGVYVTGRFAGAFDFATPDGAQQAAGLADAYVVKYGPEGAPLWVRRISSTGTTASTALVVDSDGNVVVSGLVDGSAVFDQGPRDGYGQADAFLLKLSAQGERMWSTRLGSSAFDCGVALARGERGEVVASGSFDSDLRWDVQHVLPAGPARSVYLARLATDGKPIWLARLDSNDFFTRALALTPVADGIAIAGTFRSTLRFHDGTQLESAALQDMYVARFSNEGELIWAQGFGGANYDEAWDVVGGAHDDLLVTGWFAGPVVFGSQYTTSAGWLSIPLLQLRR